MSDCLYVGIDFGSLNTAAVASNGMRKAMPTETGWAKDHLAEKRLGTKPLFGDELRKHRMALKSCRPFAKGALKYNGPSTVHAETDPQDALRAADCILQEVLRLVSSDTNQPIRGVIGVPAKASIVNKKRLLEIAEHWMDSAILVPEPFAVAYGTGNSDPALIIDIGAGTIDFCHFYGALPEEDDLETIHHGGDHIDAKLVELVLQKYPEANFSPQIAREVKEKFGFIGAAPEPIVIRLPTRTGKPCEIDITSQVGDACLSLGHGVLHGFEKLLQRVPPEYQSSISQNVFLAGGGSQLHGLDIWLEDHLAQFGQVRIQRLNDLAFAGASGALQLAMELPEAGWTELNEQRARNASTASVEGRAGVAPSTQQEHSDSKKDAA